MVIEDDCGTKSGFPVKALIEGGEVVEPPVRSYPRPCDDLDDRPSGPR